MQWNPFKKQGVQSEEEKKKLEAEMQAMTGGKDLNMFQRFAMKRIMNMSPEERNKVMQKAMTPKNIEKHKDEIMAQLDALKKSGQLSDDQYRLAKRKLGL